MTQTLLDPIPILVLIGLFAIVTMVVYEIGFRVGRWWQDRMPGEQEGPAGVLIGALLGLMAFLLAVTLGLAADRYDARRALVIDEANAIGKAYLQADYLLQPKTDQMRELLREYLPQRIVGDQSVVVAQMQRSSELQAAMWAIQAEVARSGPRDDMTSSFGESLTDIVGISESRVVAGVYVRVPETILLLLLAGSALSLGMVGYGAGLTGRRSVLSALVMVVALGAVLTIVIDLDRPQEGFLRVSQQPLLDVQKWIGTPTP